MNPKSPPMLALPTRPSPYSAFGHGANPPPMSPNYSSPLPPIPPSGGVRLGGRPRHCPPMFQKAGLADIGGHWRTLAGCPVPVHTSLNQIIDPTLKE